MTAASAKATELGFDPNRGLITLQESFINLSSARAVLEEAIEKKKLIQLPITVQKEILADLQAVAKALQGLTAGADEIVNLTNGVENLNTAMWKYGLHNLSDEVLGYQTKLNQLKNQELQISKSLSELKASQRIAERVNATAIEVTDKRNEAAAALDQVKNAADEVSTLMQQIRESENKTNAVFATLQQHEKQSGELFSSIKTASNELQALDASIRKFYSEVEEYRKKINDTGEQAASLISTSEASVKKLLDDGASKVNETVASAEQTTSALAEELRKSIGDNLEQVKGDLSQLTKSTSSEITQFRSTTEATLKAAVQELETSSSALTTQAEERLTELEKELQERSDATIGANDQKTQNLLAELEKLKGQIKEQIQQATGFAMFGAFQARQNQVAKAKKIWAFVILGLVAISVAVTAWIAYEAQQYTTHSLAFYVKLSLTLPLAFAITFCTLQYSRERRLEEEYAFKASISVSLNPYRDLVQEILKMDGKAEPGKYTDFVIDSVKNVFTPPTDKVFETEKKSGLTEKTLKQAAEVVGTVVKIAKP